MGEIVEVKIIRRKNRACLIELIHDDMLKQVIVPEEALTYTDNNKVIIDIENIDESLPYGIEWELILPNFTIMGFEIARNLYASGIRTIEDYDRNPQAVISAVTQSARPILASIQGIIKDHRRRSQ